MAEVEANAGSDLLGSRVVGELAARAPVIRTIGVEDITAALREGADDFRAMPAFGMTIGAFYALGGIAIIGVAFALDMFVLAFPLLAGFALVGPFAAMGLYEASRRRDMGQTVGIGDIFNVRRATTTANKWIERFLPEPVVYR